MSFDSLVSGKQFLNLSVCVSAKSLSTTIDQKKTE